MYSRDTGRGNSREGGGHQKTPLRSKGGGARRRTNTRAAPAERFSSGRCGGAPSAPRANGAREPRHAHKALGAAHRPARAGRRGGGATRPVDERRALPLLEAGRRGTRERALKVALERPCARAGVSARRQRRSARRRHRAEAGRARACGAVLVGEVMPAGAEQNGPRRHCGGVQREQQPAEVRAERARVVARECHRARAAPRARCRLAVRLVQPLVRRVRLVRGEGRGVPD